MRLKNAISPWKRQLRNASRDQRTGTQPAGKDEITTQLLHRSEGYLFKSLKTFIILLLEHK